MNAFEKKILVFSARYFFFSVCWRAEKSRVLFYFCLLSLHCCTQNDSATALPPTVRFGKDEVMILRTENHLGQAISWRPQA